MRYLIQKISSYNIFNYLLPGVVFVAIGEKLTSFHLIHPNWLLGLFLYYFVGLCISRVGSLVVEPALKRIRFLRFAAYEDFIEASNSDPKVEILSEQNNMYRTLCSLCLVLILLKAYDLVSWCVDPWFILVLGLLTMFLFSYRKATQYVVRRVDATLKEKERD